MQAATHPEPAVSSVQPHEHRERRPAPIGMLAAIRWVLTGVARAKPRLLAALVAIMAVQSAVPAAIAWAAKQLVDTFDSAGTVAPAFEAVGGWIALATLVVAVGGIASSVRHYVVVRLGDDVGIHVSRDVLSHAARMRVTAFYDRRELDALEKAGMITGPHFIGLLTQLSTTLINLVHVISLSVILVHIVPWSGSLVLLAIPPFVWSRWHLGRSHHELTMARIEQRRRALHCRTLLFDPNLVPEVHHLGVQDRLVDEYANTLETFRDVNARLAAKTGVSASCFGFVLAVGCGLLLVDFAWSAQAGRVTLGDLAVLVTVSTRFRSIADVGMQSFAHLRRALLEVIDLVALLRRHDHLKPRTGGRALARVVGEVRAEDVVFRYPGASEPTLRGVSLHIRPGECVALVGENGSGKSTLAHVLAGLFEVESGRVLLDETDYAELSPEELRRHVAFVFQQPVRFEWSALDNVIAGLPDEPSTAAVDGAMQAAGVHTRLQGLSRGYETALGREFGDVDLSGGEWQKLAFARALVRQTPVVILDEPTASLDPRAEYELFVQARRLLEGRSSLLISHRFSTVAIADRIVVMSGGRIVESGTHAELVAAGGAYAEMYALSQREFADASDLGSTNPASITRSVPDRV